MQSMFFERQRYFFCFKLFSIALSFLAIRDWFQIFCCGLKAEKFFLFTNSKGKHKEKMERLFLGGYC